MNGPTALRDLQRAFAAALFAPGQPLRERLRARIGKRFATRAKRPAFGAAARMGVYTHAYAARLVEVLAGDYGALRGWLGEHEFGTLARAYLAAHPSRHPNLNQLGARLPAFLRRSRADRFVLDLARLELALTRAFDAAEFTPLAAGALAVLPPARWQHARLVVNPSVQVFRVSAAAADFHAAWRRGDAESWQAPRRAGVATLCVFRADDRLGRRELPRPAATLLHALRRGEPLARAVARVPAGSPVDAWFAQWRADGIFAALR